jgi:hypothetical protein
MTDEKRKKRTEKALYWSSYDCYAKCPQRFLWRYGDPTIDLGAGLGKPKPGAKQTSDHWRIMGHTIQYAVERIYNDFLWQRLVSPDPDERWSQRKLAETLKDIVVRDLERRLDNGYIEWRWAPTPKEMQLTCIKGIIGYLKTMKANHLVGDWARAEKKYVAYLKSVPIAARVDVILRRDNPDGPLPGITILDGKNSKHKGTYTSPDQLRFYALVYYLAHGRLPDQMGFVYYRYPYGTPLKEGGIDSGVDWVPVDRDDIKGLAQKILDTRRNITAKAFEANPVPADCKWCEWEDLCAPRQAQKRANRKKRKKKKDPLPDFNPSNDGFEEMG